MEHAIHTVGYGNRDIKEFVRLLKLYGIQYLVDVRSSPYSRFRREFSKDILNAILAQHGIQYVFMGDTLGGRPDDPSCYVGEKVDYGKVERTERFCSGIDRLRTAWRKNLSICIMCSETKAHECHRSKLIGRVLASQGIPVDHIDATGQLVSQQEVIDLIVGHQKSLFEDTFTSLKNYRKLAKEHGEQ